MNEKGNEFGFLQKLHLLQIRGCLKKYSFSSNVKLFPKLPRRLIFPLRDLVGDSVLHAAHVFLGFTRDGHFLLSYTVQAEVDVNTSAPCYTYQLHWWHFMPYKPLKKMAEIRLFGESEINHYLRIVVCQWPMDEENILIYGCCPSSVQDSVQCYLTITAQPPLQQCDSCLKVKEKLNDCLSNEGNPVFRCLQHSFTVHTNFTLVPPYPSFNPSICMKKDKMVLINTGDNIISLDISVKTQTVHLDPIQSNLVTDDPFNSSDNEWSSSHLNSQNVENRTVLSNFDMISTNRESSVPCHINKNVENAQDIHPSETISTTKSNTCMFLPKQVSDDRLFFNHHHNSSKKVVHSNKLSMSSQDKLADKSIHQNSREMNKIDCPNHKEIEQMTSSKLAVSSGDGGIQSLIYTNGHSCNEKNKRTAIEDEHTKTSSIEKRRKSSEFKHSVNTNHSVLYCRETELLKQSDKSDKSDFSKVNNPFPFKNEDEEAMKENISPDPNQICACCEIFKFSSDHTCELSPKSRSEFLFCNLHCCTVTNNSVKFNQTLFVKKCVSEAVHFYMQDDELCHSRDDSDDVWNGEYPTIFSLEVYGTAYKPLKMLNKAKLQDWQGQSVIIHQRIFDIELYVHEIGQKICSAAGVKYLAFSDYDVQIIDLCPVSSVAVILVFMLVQTSVEKKDSDDASNFGRHMYQTGFKFKWNISTGMYSVMDTEELKDIDACNKTQKRWNETWNPAQLAVKRLQKTWLLSPSTLHSVNVLTNDAVFQGKSLRVLWPSTHHVAVVL